MNLKKFDPFNNRLARDIRNGLSKSFLGALSERDVSLLAEINQTLANMDSSSQDHYSFLSYVLLVTRFYGPDRKLFFYQTYRY